MQQIAENMRYLLWREEVQPVDWVSRLAIWAQCDAGRAGNLLYGAEPRETELEAIAQSAGALAEELRFSRLLEVDRVDILAGNIKYLIGTLGRGDKKDIAASLDVHPTTISRWLGGELRPHRRFYSLICRYFSLSPEPDLEREPLFLSPSPITDQARRAWLREQVDVLTADKLARIFFALELLLKDP